MRQHNEAQYSVESLLQAHSIAVEQVRVLCQSAGRYWIHQQSCDALASTYKLSLQKLTNMLTEILLSQQLNPPHLQLLVQPALDMLLAAIHQGKCFLETYRRSVSIRDQASSSSVTKSHPRNTSFASIHGEDQMTSDYTIADEKSWLHLALLKGHATDAIVDVHLHDFLIAFCAVSAAIEDLNAKYMTWIAIGRIIQHAPSPDLFWKEQNKPHVLIVSAQQLDYVKDHDDTVLNSQLDNAMNLRGYPDDVDQKCTTITMTADIDAAQLAALVKERIKCAKQAFEESIFQSFLDINQLEEIEIIIDSFPTSIRKVMWLGTEFALKVYRKSMEEAFLQEAKIHFRLHHPNVVHAVALSKGEKEYGLLLELMDENLKMFLQRHAFKLTLQEKVSVMLQIAKGMAYVHEKGIIHRDIKPSNVLVRSSMDTQTSRIQQLEVKVGDFGESRSRSPDSSSFSTKRRGTTIYRAPEVLNDDEESSNFTSSYKRSADVYSYAMTCFELLVEKEPFQNSAKRNALWKRVVEGERPDLATISDVSCPPYLKHCLQNWWASDPKTRHSFTHICCILRHLYVCLARCQKDAQPIVQFPFLAWPSWRWKLAQDIAQERMEQFKKRRADEDWKDKGYLCESTRVNEIPYELHVMKWAIKKAAIKGTEEAILEGAHNSESQDIERTDEAGTIRQSSHPENIDSVHDHSPNQQSTSHGGDSSHSPFVTSRSPENAINNTQPGNGMRSTQRPTNQSTPSKSFLEKVKEFCCFSAHIAPSNNEAFHDNVPRRNVL